MSRDTNRTHFRDVVSGQILSMVLIKPNLTRTKRLQHPSTDMDAFATSTACCDLDLWPPEANRVIIKGLVNVVIPCKFDRDGSSYSQDIVVTRSAQTNEEMNECAST